MVLLPYKQIEQNDMSIHHDLEKMKLVALDFAKKHNCNYNIILVNPDKEGKFNPVCSTYEMVTDSYFEKPRPNVILLHKTSELLSNQDDIGYVIVNNELGKAYLGHNDVFVNKLRSAIIHHDEIFANSEMWRLQREYLSFKVNKSSLSVKPVLITLI